MMRQLVFRVLWPQAAALDVAQWLCVRELVGFSVSDDVPVVSAEPVSLNAALQEFMHVHAQAMECAILLPAEMMLYDRIQLPARSKRQALQALPFVVEEQLADDIEAVHLSVGERQAAGAWPVLAFNRNLMQQLFSLLVQYGVTPVSVIVDAEALALVSGELRIVLHGDRVLLRSESMATAVEIENASLYLQMLEGSENYTRITIVCEPNNEQQRLLAQQWSTEFSALNEVVTSVNVIPDTLSNYLFSSLQPGTINLLQGEYQLKRASVGLPWWQVVAAACVLALSGQVLLQASSGWYFNHKADRLVLAAENQYREWFPDAKKVTDPRKRLEGKLASSGNLADKDAFTFIFGKTVEALKAVSNGGVMSIEQLRYEGKRSELELELKATSIEQLDKFKQALTKAGLQADISSANASDAGILGRVKIKAGS